MNQTIEITITPDGKTHLETKGFTGNSCRNASRFLEQALGQQTSAQLKSEFHQSTSEDEHIEHGR